MTLDVTKSLKRPSKLSKPIHSEEMAATAVQRLPWMNTYPPCLIKHNILIET